ncbi:predicted protein [Arabidopsis lyrata subsp. lyrata]|uniref:Predicted protein n=1 Tax=Arabidopsis lyrata subsp. lyrata TaxID=81972 RepID=D7LMV5_ARALL|nr:predicted protein [Arabidopsis lyrata subsp. lyrata]
MRAIHMRLSSSFRPILLLDFVVSCSPPRRQFSIPRRLICAAANGGGRSGSIVAAPLVVTEEDFQKKIDVNPPKGTRDFPPEDMRLRNWLFNHFKETFQEKLLSLYFALKDRSKVSKFSLIPYA